MKNKITVIKSKNYNDVVKFSLTLWFGNASYSRQTVSRYVPYTHPSLFVYAFYVLPQMKNIRYAYEQEFYLEQITIQEGFR